MGPLILRHEASLEHHTGAHPERAARLETIEGELAARGWLGYRVEPSPSVPLGTLTAVHPESHRAAVEAVCHAGGGALDPDTVVSPGSYEAALRAAGGAVALVDALIDGRATTGASLARPPGHHAEASRAMGFCLFNSVAVAARHALAARGLQRVLILDWDVHHGNGTNAIFHDDPGVLFASIHQSPLYPGSGASDDVGVGEGLGFTINLPVPAGAGDAEFTSLVDHVVVPAGRAYRPQLILISAGFDAHRDDPLAGCTMTAEGYRTMAASVRRLAEELGVPAGLVLEGGYDLDALAASLIATLEALGGPPRAEPPARAPHPLAREAAHRVAMSTPMA